MDFLRAIASAMTWRKLWLVLALAFAMVLFRSGLIPGVYSTVELWRVILAQAVVAVPCALCMLLVALAADEAAMRGMRLPWVYLSALPPVVGLDCLITWAAQQGFSANLGPDPSLGDIRYLTVGIDQGIVGMLFIVAYLNQRIATRMLARVQATEHRRQTMERSLLQSRLASTAAQVDAHALLASLAGIKRDLERGSPEAEVGIETLTQSLREALARSRLDDTGVIRP